MAKPGPHLICWPFYTIAGRVSIRIQQLDVACETKTSDNVFVNVVISVQYAVQTEHVYEAFYVLNDPSEQITSYVCARPAFFCPRAAAAAPPPPRRRRRAAAAAPRGGAIPLSTFPSLASP